MALNKKFASLPDIDSAPDIYETPSLTEDTSTIPESIAQSPSSSSSFHEISEGETSHVDRRRINPNDARMHFRPARVDARNADFSDRVGQSRRFYETSSRHLRGTASDENRDDESLEMRLSHLRQEIEELRADVQEGGDILSSHNTVIENDLATNINQLSDSLDSIYISRYGGTFSPEIELEQIIRKFSTTGVQSPPEWAPQREAQGPNASRPSHDKTAELGLLDKSTSHKFLEQITSFDIRLSTLEQTIGASKVGTIDPDETRARSLLDSVDILDRQMASIMGASSSFLDGAIHKIRQLHQDVERFEALRKATQSHEQEYETTSTTREKTNSEIVMSSEHLSKINALHGTLGTIDTLSRDLPLILDRLRTLRSIHSVSGKASSLIEEIEKMQTQHDAEVSQWKESLQNVEEKLAQGEQVASSNSKLIGDWVKDLQERIDKIR